MILNQIAFPRASSGFDVAFEYNRSEDAAN